MSFVGLYWSMSYIDEYIWCELKSCKRSNTSFFGLFQAFLSHHHQFFRRLRCFVAGNWLVAHQRYTRPVRKLLHETCMEWTMTFNGISFIQGHIYIYLFIYIYIYTVFFKIWVRITCPHWHPQPSWSAMPCFQDWGDASKTGTWYRVQSRRMVRYGSKLCIHPTSMILRFFNV